MKIETGKKTKYYCKKLLQVCKTWSGTCTSAEELCVAIREHSEKKKHLFSMAEMAYYVHTHKAEKVLRPELLRLNGITLDEKLENLLILLEG